MIPRTVHRLIATATAAVLAISMASCSPPKKESTPAALVEQSATKNSNPTASPEQSTQTETLPTCVAAQLSPMIDSSQTGAGTTVSTVRLTNTGADCVMFGYPGVSFISTDGSQIGAPADRDASDKPESVVVASNTAVHFRVRLSNAMAFDAKQCQPTKNVASLKIFPPNDKGFITVPISQVACQNPAVVIMTVGAVHR